MKQIIPNLFVGKVSELAELENDNLNLVNLSAIWHKKYHEWEGKPDNKDPYYIVHEGDDFITLNWVDGPAKYFDYEGKGIMRIQQIMDFMVRSFLDDKKVVIVCDQAQSRSPSIALLWLARVHFIRNNSYPEAKQNFIEKYYPEYQPGEGIQEFLTSIWDKFVEI